MSRCQSIYKPFVLLLTVVFCLLFTVSASADTKNTLREETIVIGVISSNPKKAFKRTQPFADYLAENLSNHGIKTGQVAVARDFRQMARWIKSDHVDLVSETVFAAQELTQSTGAELLARRWKSGVAEYHSIFFSKLNNGVDSLDDLRGKTVVFEDVGSTSAFLVPAAILLEQGYELFELSSPREHPPEDTIGYFLSDEYSKSGGESNMMSWVYRNIVASAAFSNLDWEKEIPEQVKQQLQVIHTSQPIPRSLILTRPSLPYEFKQDLLAVLLSAHESEEGKQALKAYKNTKKFDAITPEVLNSLSWAATQKLLVDGYISR
ncbi:phosphate/phosphite/phosphonate ABC transporter substrate-binding protein [Vibrio cyclitrophicus]|uniref:phosphate/phosphite/phosphonate ABC transporter substrate-binding protein n=1 Tax=Vibrio cyclitrophicus TaxID=47951 RepID=UPI00067F296D|nr:phosphate/phosphite/phosphonate ABC transporter substrate-binding protein [Vibrio cyclitrophicus]KNH14461.1 alkylphosphonate ABC transporter [Vibrio lentus]PMJ52678.1 alkylphosphonate ABC transporter [Vibrio cyclitrophicus]